MKFDRVPSGGIHGFVSTLPLVLVFCTSAGAQSTGPQLRAAISVVPPFAMEQNGALTGFSIDLWNAIAALLNVQTNYQIVPDPSAALEALKSNKADVIASPIVMTAARDDVVDFSMPILDGGCRSWCATRAKKRQIPWKD
jgi:polar amino acid transport system substrate-binding protein